jgi:hypothetical protein
VVFAMHAVALLPSSSKVLASHATFGAVAPAQYVPASQGAQVGALEGVPGAVCTVPGGQAFAGRHCETFGCDE